MGYLGAGAAAARMHGGRIGGHAMSGGGQQAASPADPPVGEPLREPPVLTGSRSGRTVEIDLEAGPATVDVNGTPARLLTYNGAFPGPTIRVRRGDILTVNYTNRLPRSLGRNFLGYDREVTNLHTHGWHISPEAPSDYVMYSLRSGERYRHTYDTSTQPGGTLCFYHTHAHGVAAEQYWAGMMGALVMEDETPVLAAYETRLMILKDISIVEGRPAPHAHMHAFMHGLEGATVMVNGQVNPRLVLKKGQVQRWRLVNGSTARFYRLGLEGHGFHLIGTDGGLLDKPYPVPELLLSPGERVDVLVEGTHTSGSHRLLALPYSRMGMGGRMGGGMRMGMGGNGAAGVTLLTVSNAGEMVPAQALPAAVNPAARRLDPSALRIAAERRITLGMGHGRGYINGHDFDVKPYTITSALDTYEIWTVENPSGMDHPFHQHVNEAQILEVSGGDAVYAGLYPTIPAWKDTTLIPKRGSVRMLVPVRDFSGMAMIHCHILEHEDIGMMGVWNLGQPGKHSHPAHG
jgi:FtsP/CotA-like multicopper oxidase with cupredoxin domain